MRLYLFVLLLGTVPAACVDTSGKGMNFTNDDLPDDRQWSDGVYGRVLGYFESAGRDNFEPLPGAMVAADIDGAEQIHQAGATGRYSIEGPEGIVYPTVEAAGYRTTGNAMVEYLGSPYEINIYAVSDETITEQAALGAVTQTDGNAVVIAHLVNADTMLAEANVAVANVTLTGAGGTPTAVGIGLTGSVDPAVTATVVNEDGDAAVIFFNVTGGDYTLTANGGTVDLTVPTGGAHVARVLIP